MLFVGPNKVLFVYSVLELMTRRW
uniref:Uncharacterized protein n=1 Tax=Arundo donax TaxID=35708 RepID=A0A0A8ZD81_ARUDO